jgi:cytochrome P450
MAGHETTANSLAFTWYLLSQNHAAEAKLHAELAEVLGGRLPTIADLPRLVYTENVFRESLRLYPPGWVITRQAAEDTELGGYTVPRDAILVLSEYVMHRHPRYFPEPERFDPDRWTPEFRAALHPYAYIPFGGGPRKCIGEHFAWMEGTLVLATLCQRWRPRLAPGFRVVPDPVIMLRPKHGIRMILEPRA